MPCKCRVEATPLDRRLWAMSSSRTIYNQSDYGNQNNDRKIGDNAKLISLYHVHVHVHAQVHHVMFWLCSRELSMYLHVVSKAVSIKGPVLN